MFFFAFVTLIDVTDEIQAIYIGHHIHGETKIGGINAELLITAMMIFDQIHLYL
jgi:hypothetical protein